MRWKELRKVLQSLQSMQLNYSDSSFSFRNVYRYSGNKKNQGGGWRSLLCCCKVIGCDKARRSGGKCRKHGGGSRCKLEGCDKSSHSNGKCWTHGDLSRRCQVEGCDTMSKRGNRCTRHREPCGVIGCKTMKRGGEKCWRHGGGVRCQVAGCSGMPRKSAKNWPACFAHLDFPGAAASSAVKDDKMESQQDCSLGPALGKSLLYTYSFVRITLF